MALIKKVAIDTLKHPGGYGVYRIEGNCYYYTDPDHYNERVIITLDDSPAECPGYLKANHKPKSPDAIIECVEDQAGPIFDFNSFAYGCISVTIYSWSGDKSFNPLIIQVFREKNDVHYITHDGRNWVNAMISKDEEMNEDGGMNEEIVKCLDGQNCKWNYAHLVDISQDSGDRYKCTACQAAILIKTSIKNEYKIISHTPEEGYVGKIRHGQKTLVGLEIEEDVPSVDVYWYPHKTGRALIVKMTLILTDEQGEPKRVAKWYRRSKDNNGSWTMLPTPISDAKLIKLLREVDKETRSYFYPARMVVRYAKSTASLSDLTKMAIIGSLIGAAVLCFFAWKVTPRLRRYLANRYFLL